MYLGESAMLQISGPGLQLQDESNVTCLSRLRLSLHLPGARSKKELSPADTCHQVYHKEGLAAAAWCGIGASYSWSISIPPTNMFGNVVPSD